MRPSWEGVSPHSQRTAGPRNDSNIISIASAAHAQPQYSSSTTWKRPKPARAQQALTVQIRVSIASVAHAQPQYSSSTTWKRPKPARAHQALTVQIRVSIASAAHAQPQYSSSTTWKRPKPARAAGPASRDWENP